jgi:hypothetical protein
MESTTVGSRRSWPPTVVEAAEDRLHDGGWGDTWLEKVYETLLKHVAFVSNTFHQLYPATHHLLKYISTVLVLAASSTGLINRRSPACPDPCSDRLRPAVLQEAWGLIELVLPLFQTGQCNDKT